MTPSRVLGLILLATRNRVPFRGLAGVICLTILVIAAPASADHGQVHYLPSHPGRWHPFGDGGTDHSLRLTPAEIKTIRAHAQDITDIFKRAKALSPPVGFDVVGYRTIDTPEAWEPPGAVPLTLRMAFLRYLYYVCSPTCIVKVEGEAVTGISLWVNRPGMIFDRAPQWEDAQGAMFEAPRLVGRVAGFPEYDTRWIVITKITRPLWLTVSQERFIRNEIRISRADLAKATTATTESAYQIWLREREERLRAFRQAYEELKKTDPQAAERLRAQMEQIEEETTKRLKAEEPKGQANVRKGIEFGKRHLQALEAELASLSSAERSAQAYFDHNERRPSGLADPSSPTARPVVAPNPHFFDRKVSRTDPQIIMIRENPKIRSMLPCTNTDCPQIWRMLTDIFSTLDWSLLAGKVR